MEASALLVAHEHRVSIQVRNLTVSILPLKKALWKRRTRIRKTDPESPTKHVLDNVSFAVSPGSFVAIMGGTGSGKTTLLNTLSTRLNAKQNLAFQGSVTYSTKANDRHISNSYLLQSDVFLPGLTVRETLQFQADLRMPPLVTASEKKSIIDSLLDVLELSHVRGSMVATYTGTVNLSGGEQRRLSLAVQLLNKPSLVFLDEPTTGLDASNSLRLMQLVKRLTSVFGITVICAIHQPRVEVTRLFDQLCLLTRGGRMVYYGDLSQAETYFLDIDWLDKGKSHANFVDYIMQLSVKDTSTKSLELAAINRIDNLVSHWTKCSGYGSEIPSVEESKCSFETIGNMLMRPPSTRIKFSTELTILSKRSFKLCIRDRMSLAAFTGGIIVLGCGFGWLFYRPDHDLGGIRSLSAALYTTLQVIGFTPMFIELERLWGAEGQNFFREYKEGCVSIPGFVFSRRIGRVLLEDIPITILWSITTFFMWGLRGGAGRFFIYFLMTFLTEISGMTLALTCFGLGPEFAVSALILNVYYQVQNSTCGFFVNSKTMPVYVRWLKYCAFFWYSYGAMLWNQFHGWMGSCPEGENCQPYSGDYQIDTLGLPHNFMWQQVGICMAFIIGYIGLAIVSLRLKNFDMSIATTKKNKWEKEDEKEVVHHNMPTVSTVSVPIKINLQEITLDIQPKWYKKSSKMRVLSGISCEFSANKLNVIMGPSGSGKTTLLNYLSYRLPRSMRYTDSGSIFLNNAVISPKELSLASAYVAQHDHTLIPALTVRETLHFQAKLRLHRHELPQINIIVNDLLQRMSLVDCADTMIGSDTLKGISGGEKRRVSIAIQLLSRPHILFLDEPTSGLDSATAFSVLLLLHELATQGHCTIILTVHQPSEEMVKLFNSVLLLAKRGRMVYDGSFNEMIKYFEKLGHAVPPDANVADYVLDLVSRQMDETSDTSEARIDKLVETWSTSCSPSENGASSESIDLKSLRRSRASFMSVLVTIVYRQSLATFRTPDVLFTRAFQGVSLAAFYTLFFAPLRNKRDGVDNRLGLLQSLLNMYFVGLLNNISLYPVERGVFYQEYRDGVYSSFQYCLAYLINEIPFEVFQCLLFSILCVFGIGMPRNASMFFVNFLSMFVTVNCGESVGLMWNSVFDHLGFATNLMSMCILFAVFMGGTMSMQLPGFFRGVNWINPMKYVVRTNAPLMFNNQDFHCGDQGCPFDHGWQVLQYYHLNGSIAKNIGGLLACFVAYRVVAITLCIIKVKYFI